MTLTKKIDIKPEALDVLPGIMWGEQDGQVVGRIARQLDRKLYEEVNKALEALGGKWNRNAKGHLFKTDPRPQIDDLLDSGQLIVERDGFFETPWPIALQLARLAQIEPGMDVLEPSAGLGALCKAILEEQPDCKLYTIEKNEQRVEALQSKGYTVVGRDFLEYRDKWHAIEYDRIVMNPPFEQLQDIDHVMAAHFLLKEGGRLVSVMSESPFFRSDKRAVEFRDWLDATEHQVIDLDHGAFKESGTNVKTRIVVIDRTRWPVGNQGQLTLFGGHHA